MPSFDHEVTQRREHVRALADAERDALNRIALGVSTPPAADIAAVHMVVAEDAPVQVAWRLDGDEAVELTAQWLALPEPWAGELERIGQAEPGAVRCCRCGAYVGWREHTAEGPHGEDIDTLRWTLAALVRDPDDPGAAFSVQCESCMPVTDLAPWGDVPPTEWWGDMSRCASSPDRRLALHRFPQSIALGGLCLCGQSTFGLVKP